MAIADSSSMRRFDQCNKYIYEIYKGRDMHRHYVQANTSLFICYCWRSKFIHNEGVDMKI